MFILKFVFLSFPPAKLKSWNLIQNTSILRAQPPNYFWKSSWQTASCFRWSRDCLGQRFFKLWFTAFVSTLWSAATLVFSLTKTVSSRVTWVVSLFGCTLQMLSLSVKSFVWSEFWYCNSKKAFFTCKKLWKVVVNEWIEFDGSNSKLHWSMLKHWIRNLLDFLGMVTLKRQAKPLLYFFFVRNFWDMPRHQFSVESCHLWPPPIFQSVCDVVGIDIGRHWYWSIPDRPEHGWSLTESLHWTGVTSFNYSEICPIKKGKLLVWTVMTLNHNLSI